MTGRYPEVPLGEILTQVRDEVEVRPDETYRPAGIYSFGRGLFARPPISGAETRYTRFTVLRPGQFVVSRLNGWEGAVDVVSDEFAGFVVSNEYPTFGIDESRADPQFLMWLCRWDVLWDRLTPKGSMVRRKRVSPAAVFSATVPLPPRDEQRRIADWLDRIVRFVSQVQTRVETDHTIAEWLTDSELIAIVGDVRHQPLGVVAEVNPRPIPRRQLDPDAEVAFVPMAAVDDRTGTIARPQSRALAEVASGYRQFLEGDLIFARITPCMQNGKSAIADSLAGGIGYGSTEFHVIRPSEILSPKWLHLILRSRSFRVRAQGAFQGGAGQQRVPARYLEEVQIPVPPLGEQERFAAHLRKVETGAAAIRSAYDLRRAELEALVPAAINHALSQ